MCEHLLGVLGQLFFSCSIEKKRQQEAAESNSGDVIQM
jgi:hypothetical protein